MNTPYDTRLPAHLASLKQEIEGYARDYGLDFYETIFEVIDAEDLNEIAAYGGFPTRYPHWSFGMQFEELKKGYDYGLSKIYEMVINNDPCYAYLMRSNHTVDQKLVMAHVYGHCLAPETKVETISGVKAIADIAVGEQVLTHTGRYRPVMAVAKRWHSGPILKLSVGGTNQGVRITEEHPVLVVRGDRCVLAGREEVPCKPTCQLQHKCSSPRPHEAYRKEWIPAGEVRPGDWVAFPRRRRLAELAAEAVEIVYDKVLHRQRRIGRHILPVDASLARFIGYFLAEGNAQARGLVGFGFHRDEEAYQREVTDLATKLFGARVGRDDSRNALATTIRFNNLEVARWLREVVGLNAASKTIPPFIFEHASLDVLSACLGGLFNGDGTFTRSVGRESGTLSVTTISEKLAYQLRHASLRLGAKVAIYGRARPRRRPSFDLVWSGESAHTMSRLFLGEDVIEGNRSFERSWADADYLYQPVRSVEAEPYADYVYNFSVADDESYTLAAGFAVHNCDFFKNNAYFAHTSRKMMDEMANHGARIRGYAEKYGEDEVEAFVDRCMSIDDLIDIHSVAIRRRAPSMRFDFKPDSDNTDDGGTRFKSKDYMDEYVNPRDVLKAEAEKRKKDQEQLARNFPEQPEKDVLLFLIENAPLKNWQRDVLSIIRDEAYYFMPQGMTKISNEGWACVDASTFLYTDQGLRRIGDIVDRQIPARVSDGSDLRSIRDWVCFEDRETVAIRTQRGLTLTGSTTHRVMLPNGQWKRLDEVEVGDSVCVRGGGQLWATRYVSLPWRSFPETITRKAAILRVAQSQEAAAISTVSARGVQQNLWPDLPDAEDPIDWPVFRGRPIRVPNVVDEQFGSFLGYLIGDGHISEKKRPMGLTTGDESQADDFVRLATDLFGMRPVKKWDKTKWRISFSSVELQDYLKHLGLKTGACAREKTVPDCILRSPKPVVVAFLRALYDCDGYAGKAGVILSTSSTEMSKVVQLLLLNFGILSSRRRQQHDIWHVATQGKSAAKFLEGIGFGLQRKQDALRAYVDGHHWYKEQPWDDEVVAIERGRADVYDITVETTHRYAAQGFINHNSYWHSTIMTQKALSPSELIDYADHHSGTMAMSRTRLNPYKLGIELLRDIEFRWNTGRFGKEWEECDDVEKKRTWDKQLGLGRKKIYEVRRIHNDITFIDTFLTPEFCVQHNFFSYAFQEQAGQYYIESRDFEKIKQRLLFSLTNFGKPWIYVVDGNHRNRGELLLKHHHSGVDLKLDQAADTLANVQFVWGRPVHLSTMVDGKLTTLSFDGTDHSIKSGGETDDARRNAPAKTR